VQRCIAILTALVLLGVLGTPGTALAAGPTWNQCRAPGAPTISPTWHVYRNVSGRAYTYAIGTTVVENLHACDPGNGYDQFAGTFVANLQDAGQCFMQIGYGDGDGSGGLRYFASSDSLGTGNVTSMSLGFSPSQADVSTFSIFTVSVDGDPYWELRVTKGSTYGYRLISQKACQGSMPEVWFGIETHNYADQFGGPSNPALVALYSLGYKYSGGPSAITYLQDTINAAWANSPNTIPTCWHPGITTYGSSAYTKLYGYTDCRP